MIRLTSGAAGPGPETWREVDKASLSFLSPAAIGLDGGGGNNTVASPSAADNSFRISLSSLRSAGKAKRVVATL
jgi:hypothetical protein